MSSRLNPYLSFAGNAREAMEFYQSVLGGELALSTFGEFGDSSAPNADQIMHGLLDTAKGYTLMGADMAPDQADGPPVNSPISISGDDGDDLRGYWEKLSDGGNVQVPLEKQMWGDEFGMCTDKFGIGWLVNISAPQV